MQISLSTKNEPHSSSSPFQNVAHEITLVFVPKDTFCDQVVTFATWRQGEYNAYQFPYNKQEAGSFFCLVFSASHQNFVCHSILEDKKPCIAKLCCNLLWCYSDSKWGLKPIASITFVMDSRKHKY
jgi:hypothetical protein